MSLTAAQKWAIGADLSLLKQIGFSHVRLLTHNKAGDPALAGWPQSIFLSFPQPTPVELENLYEFTQMTALFGMTYEVVFVMSAGSNRYYDNGTISAQYRNFMDAVWSAIWGGMLSRIYFGGDLRLGDHDPDPELVSNHREFISTEWPYFADRADRRGLAIGMNLMNANASLWDLAVDSIAWARANLSRAPSFFGCQFYPSSHAALIAGGYEHNGSINWRLLTQDWLSHLRAAAGPIPVHADEIGMLLGGEFTQDDQHAFLPVAVDTLAKAGTGGNIWEFADHAGIGLYGLYTAERAARPAVDALRVPLGTARSYSLQPGIAYTPPESVGLQWLMPGGV